MHIGCLVGGCEEEEEGTALPRLYPRSKVQLILDAVEDRHYKRLSKKRSYWITS